MRSIVALTYLFTLLALAGCATMQPAPLTAVRPTATLHPLFEQTESGRTVPAVGGTGSFEPAPARNLAVESTAPGAAPGEPAPPSAIIAAEETLQPPGTATGLGPVATSMPGAANTPVPAAGAGEGSDATSATSHAAGATTAERSEPETLYIFSDVVHPGWTLQNSDGISYRVVEPARAYAGTAALALTPMADFGTLFFTVKPGAAEAYPRRQVERVVFWLYSPNIPLNLDSLAVTVVGSNVYPYWIKGDNSVENDSWPIFSETRLEFLGFNHPIPADTWAQVEIWLDDLLYDPVYEWLTGFYIKNDEGFYETVIIDELHLVMVAE